MQIDTLVFLGLVPAYGELVEITAAVLDNGLLHIDLRQPKPQRNARNIRISSASGAAKGATIDVAVKEA